MRFKTENGSIYILDHDTMGWSREPAASSGTIRQEFGTLIEWPRIVVGKEAFLQDTNVQPGYDEHWVHTSRVVEILGDKE